MARKSFLLDTPPGVTLNTADWTTPEESFRFHREMKQFFRRNPPIGDSNRRDRDAPGGALRDNIARVGRNTFDLTTSVGRQMVVNAVCATLSRTSCAMVQHYAFGRGVSRSLSSFGIASAFENHASVRRVVEQFRTQILTAINDRLKSTCRNSSQDNRQILTDSFNHNDRASIDVTGTFPSAFFSELFALGNGRLNRTAQARISADCQRGLASIDLEMTFSYRDEFKDPADLFDIVDGNIELLGAQPFHFFHDWSVRDSLRNVRI